MYAYRYICIDIDIDIAVSSLNSQTHRPPMRTPTYECTSKGFALTWYRALTWYPPPLEPPAHSSSPRKLLARGGGAPLLPGNESRIVRHGTAQQTVVLAKSTKLKHGTKLGRTLC